MRHLVSAWLAFLASLLPLEMLGGSRGFRTTLAPATLPSTPTVTQGSASFNTTGNQLTINQSTAQAYINWASFDIGSAATVLFNQPSSTSVSWNQINSGNLTTIAGDINANGYVVLQNPKGFSITGSAVINANGLVVTASPVAATPPDLASGGPWTFNAPRPNANVVNYGQINASTFLIGYNVDNEGTIVAPGENIGLYGGKKVLVSTRPDGLGLSAQVTLAAAGAGLQAVVNNGILQANSVQNVNGTIELVSAGSVTLNANSAISAAGAASGTSPGGSVLIGADGAYTDTATATVSVAGGAQGGNAGQLEIYAGTFNPILAQVDGQALSGFQGGTFTLGSANLDVTSTLITTTLSQLTPFLNGGFSQIGLQADNILQFDTVWNLPEPTVTPTLLTLSAGNDIIFNSASGLKDLPPVNTKPASGYNWSISLSAGLGASSAPAPGNDGIYLLGNASIRTYNGNISLYAANEVILNDADGSDFDNDGQPVNVTLLNGTTVDALNSGGSSQPLCGITTANGGSISVTTTYGNVNTGGNPNGYGIDRGAKSPPYYSVSSQLGGISTENGGNVTINAGGNVCSYLPTQDNYNSVYLDGGCGAFGANPGNVTITAGGSVTGNYIVANGAGRITANGNVGSLPFPDEYLAPYGLCALNLVNGSWTVSAPNASTPNGAMPNGNIYLQDIRNPNGIFNDVLSSPYFHYFDYGLSDSVSLQAADSVVISGADAPHTTANAGAIPFVFPSSLTVSAGAGGFNLGVDVALFPSPYQDLHITTINGGDFQGSGNYLEMSDSAAKAFNPDANVTTFSPQDHAGTAPQFVNTDPVTIVVSGNLEDVTLYTTKATQITVSGNAFNANLVGQNLSGNDVTSVNVAGSISYSPTFVFTPLTQLITSAAPQVSSQWDTIFSLIVNPSIANLALNGNETLSILDSDINNFKLFNPSSATSNPFTYRPSANPGFLYDSASQELAYQHQMTTAVLNALTGPLEIVQGNPQTGLPVLVPGNAALGQNPAKYYFATTTVNFVPALAIEKLYIESQASTLTGSGSTQPGFQIGGPGKFNITAGSMDLGSSEGILSWGVGYGSGAARDYTDMNSLTPFEHGAAVSVNVSGNLTMLSSTIASLFGGDVTVNVGGELDLSQGHFALPMGNGVPAFGIYTSGFSGVDVVADGDINVGNSRIGAFNGGDVSVTSLDGNVNAGYGANTVLVVPAVFKDPTSGQLSTGQIGQFGDPRPYGSGILAIAPAAESSWTAHPVPGNITVDAPNKLDEAGEGNITSATGGIEQFALDNTIAPGPSITLMAGTPATAHSPASPGSIDLGAGGVIGGTVNLTAQGDITGLIVSHQNTTIVASQNVNVSVLAGGNADVSGGGSVQGTIAGIGGVSVSGLGTVSANLMGQNVSVNGGTSQSTLGTTAAATSTSEAAAQASTAQAEQEVASNNATDEGNDNKKRDRSRPVLARKVGRVTVILPKAN